MELDALKLFLDIARAGSFAEAARRLNLDPSLVSRRIGALEKELGFRLFQRTTRTISLTEAGAEFLNRVEPHLTAIDEARIASRDLVQQPTGLLRITASTTFGYEVLTPILPGFATYAPSVRLELILTDRRIDLIDEGIDLAIRLGVLEESDLIARRIMPVAFRIYASPEYLKNRAVSPTPPTLTISTV
jgi:DNA-binding transcriptional LysR family regulator